MPAGRPSDYRQEFIKIALDQAQRGATDIEIADELGISTATLYRWKNTHPEFCEALKVGKDIADSRVERSLYQKAIGYEQDAVKIFLDSKAGVPVYAPYRERVAPDTTAGIFWLKNRKAKEWRDKVDHTLSGPDGGPIEVSTDWSKLSQEEREAVRQALAKVAGAQGG